MDEAVQTPAKETLLWQIATDKKYSKQIVALDDFLSQVTPDDVDAVEGAMRGTRADTSRKRTVSSPSRPNTGFGGGSSRASQGDKSKARNAKKKRR